MRVLFDPAPRVHDEIFSSDCADRFAADHDVVFVNEADRDALYASHLPETEILISQQPMSKDRLDHAPNLRAIINVETNFLPNIDYAKCFERGIHVLAPSSVFAVSVAEIGLGMALSLARNIHGGHADFVARQEQYGLVGNQDAELLTESNIGFVGYGDLGRALHNLLPGFRATIRAHDPWLPDGHLQRAGIQPASLKEVLSKSRTVFVVASVTSESTHLLNSETLGWMQDGANLILLSRAAVADFDALADYARSGRLRVATDVFPEEPVPLDDPIRKVPNILFSAHRAGALTHALQQIGTLVLEDMELIAKGLPPVSCKRAERETVARMQSKPIDFS